MYPSPAPVRGLRATGGRLLPIATASLALALACALQPIGVVAQEVQSRGATTTQGHTADQPTAATQPFDLSDEVVRDVLTNLQRGVETHNLERVLDIFDPEEMKDYSQFRDQMMAFFRLHDSVKFRYQLLQVTADKDQGSAVADLEMDAEPSDILPTTERRSTQMRFQLKRGPKGWKVVGLRPSDFFNE